MPPTRKTNVGSIIRESLDRARSGVLPTAAHIRSAVDRSLEQAKANGNTVAAKAHEALKASAPKVTRSGNSLTSVPARRTFQSGGTKSFHTSSVTRVGSGGSTVRTTNKSKVRKSY